ncbi:hypothetical protein C8R46DRAFT_1107719, partial [Mycena filopes]
SIPFWILWLVYPSKSRPTSSWACSLRLHHVHMHWLGRSGFLRSPIYGRTSRFHTLLMGLASSQDAKRGSAALGRCRFPSPSAVPSGIATFTSRSTCWTQRTLTGSLRHSAS